MLASHPRGELLGRAAADFVAALGQALARDGVPAGLGQHRTCPPHNLWRHATRTEQPDSGRHMETGQPRLVRGRDGRQGRVTVGRGDKDRPRPTLPHEAETFDAIAAQPQIMLLRTAAQRVCIAKNK
jgi:hypothetical protein